MLLYQCCIDKIVKGPVHVKPFFEFAQKKMDETSTKNRRIKGAIPRFISAGKRVTVQTNESKFIDLDPISCWGKVKGQVVNKKDGPNRVALSLLRLTIGGR